MLPADKAKIIGDLQAEGKVVAMVGAGINDAPALARETSESPSAAVPTSRRRRAVSSSSAKICGMLPRRSGSAGLRCARSSQNLFWAFAYNTVGIPIAAFGLLNPIVAAAAMALSSLSVVTNSAMLKTVRV